MLIIPQNEESINEPYVSDADEMINVREMREKNERVERYLFESLGFTLKTAPFDPRFRNHNQTRNCWQNFMDYQKCIRAKGEDYAPCEYFKWVYKIICPELWTSRWDDYVSENRFPGILEPPKELERTL